jgi:alcohol dehydrogenase (cytochrome c)
MLLALAGCGGGGTGGGSVTGHGASIRANVDWPWFGGSQTGTRATALTDIAPSNVRRLGLAWSRSIGEHAALWESYPIVRGGLMYVTTNAGQVLALDPVNGRTRWTYTPVVPLVGGADGGPPINRGVTVAGGLVFAVTTDDRLLALDARTGRLRWRRRVAEPSTGATQNSPPAYWRGRVIVGSAGADVGVRGFVAAYAARTGEELWRFDTVPPPGVGWMPAGTRGGGGHVWMPPTVDPTTGTVYAGTGNPSPSIVPSRTGCARWTDATIALDARTGRLRWGHSEQCGDVVDSDSGQPPVVFDAHRGGRTVRTVGHANKDGTYWLLDAATGRVAAKSRALVPQTQPRPTGRDVARGVRVCPGALGGIAYSPAAVTGSTIFQPAVVQCMTYRTTADARRRGPGSVVGLGGGLAQPDAKETARGVLVALDAATGAVRWRRPTRAPLVGGALATTTGLVFSGSDDGNLYAFDAATGHPRWAGHVGLAFGSAPITYRAGGVQYLAVAAGGSSLAQLTGAPVGARLVVLRLGGRPLS